MNSNNKEYEGYAEMSKIKEKKKKQRDLLTNEIRNDSFDCSVQ